VTFNSYASTAGKRRRSHCRGQRPVALRQEATGIPFRFYQLSKRLGLRNANSCSRIVVAEAILRPPTLDDPALAGLGSERTSLHLPRHVFGRGRLVRRSLLGVPYFVVAGHISSRIGERLHRDLVIRATEESMSLNQYVVKKGESVNRRWTARGQGPSSLGPPPRVGHFLRERTTKPGRSVDSNLLGSIASAKPGENVLVERQMSLIRYPYENVGGVPRCATK